MTRCVKGDPPATYSISREACDRVIDLVSRAILSGDALQLDDALEKAREIVRQSMRIGGQSC